MSTATLAEVLNPDAATKRRNEKAGHTLCEHCSGTGNELYSMYRACPECGGDGIALKYGELSAVGRWRAERRDRRTRKKLERQYASPRDWNLELRWRLSRWFAVGRCFGGYEECHRCHAPAGDIDYEVRRVRPFRIECLDAGMCRESQEEMQRAESTGGEQ